MKVVWKRKYNIKKRLYIEGLYLNEAGFEVGKGISYNLNKNNKSAMIKLSDSSIKNKVTHNISRSKKVVPTIGVRNKNVEKFINSNSNMELIVFNGVIVLLTKDESNKNIALCEAFITHNKSLKENIKSIFKSLIKLGIIEDDIILNEIESVYNEKKDMSFVYKEIPKRVLMKLKKSFRNSLYKENKPNTITRKTSSSFILCSLMKPKKKDTLDDNEEEDLLKEFLVKNYENIITITKNLKSLIKQKSIFKNSQVTTDFYLDTSLEHYKLRKISIKNKLNWFIPYYKIIYYLKILITLKLNILGKAFLETRREINTLSPPSLPKSCLKRLV